MSLSASRPEIDPPAEIAEFVARLRPGFDLVELWLFGSRARKTASVDSDWDLLAIVPDEAPLPDPIAAWEFARTANVPVTLLMTRMSDLESIWGLPNTIGYDIASEGMRIRVG